ncbi:MAG: IS200/IS605 family transposase, partial [Clostridia bacterium]
KDFYDIIYKYYNRYVKKYLKGRKMDNYKKTDKHVYLLQYHIIWCPKYRKNLLVNEIKEKLTEIINSISNQNNCTIKSLEVMPNHVHLLISLDYKISVQKFMKLIKGRSSNELRSKFPELLKMSTLWTRSFFVSSIGNISENTVKNYIESQWKKQ